MKLDKDVKIVLKNIDFINRYRELSDKHPRINDAVDLKIDPVRMQSIICSLGYSSEFDKKESFFKILEDKDGFHFQFNIIIMYSTLQFVWRAFQGKQKIDLAWGPWESIVEFVTLERYTRRPHYYSYSDVEEIVREGLLIFEDFMKQIIEVKRTPAS